MDHIIGAELLEENDGFFLACEDLGRFFFKWRSFHAHLIHFLRQDQSTVAQ